MSIEIVNAYIKNNKKVVDKIKLFVILYVRITNNTKEEKQHMKKIERTSLEAVKRESYTLKAKSAVLFNNLIHGYLISKKEIAQKLY